MRKYASILITAGFFGLFIWYGVTNKESLEALKNVALWSLVVISLGKMLGFLSNGLFTKWTAEAFTDKFSAGEGIYISILSAIGNFFGPLLGGTSIRAVYLKKYHKLSYSKFTSTLMGYYLMLFMTTAVLAIVSLLLLQRTHQTLVLIFFFAVWLLVLTGFTFIKLPNREKLSWLEKVRIGRFVVSVAYDIEEGWQILMTDKRLLLKLGSLAWLSLFASYFISFVEFNALHIHVGFAALGLYTSLVAVSILISLTPGAIGIREAMLILVSTTIGVSNQQIVQVAIIDRGVHFLLLGILFLITRSPKFRKLLTAREVSV